MKKRLFSILCAAALLLSGCAARGEEGESVTIVATTYPIYLFARELTAGVEEVAVERLDTGSTSCLHDYNLTVNDMKKLERAGLIALNGVGLEEFMHDALSTSDAAVVDCSAGVELLENLSHHHEEEGEEGHDHGHFDAHIWMDPANAAAMVETLAAALEEFDPDNAPRYAENLAGAREELAGLREKAAGLMSGLEDSDGLITFHDGFHYFAHAFDLSLLESIEEEAGSEASAREIVEITALVKEHHLPVIFTEVNGSDATAKAITRETGCTISRLSMLMDGPEDGDMTTYCDGILANAAAIAQGFAREEGKNAP